MVHVGEVILNASDRLKTAVVDALSSGYCPTNRSAFLLELVALAAIFCVAGVTLYRFGRIARIAGILLVCFALGGAALDLFGFLGCGNHNVPGLSWNRPW